MSRKCKQERGNFLPERLSGCPRVPSGLHGGYTFLEVLVALAVLSVILTATYAVFSSIASGISAVREDSEVYQSARVILDRLFLDLSCATLSHSVLVDESDSGITVRRPFVCDVQSGGARSFPTLSFSSTTHLALTERTLGLDLTHIKYVLVEDQHTGLFSLRRYDDPFPRMQRMPQERYLVLGERIASFDLRWFDSQGRSHTTWNSSEGHGKGRLPRRVELNFSLVGTDETEHRFASGWSLPPGVL